MRTRTYIAADWDGDRDLVDQIYEWNESSRWGMHFPDAHDLMQSRDASKACSIKESLRKRLEQSKTFVLIVGDSTDRVTKGACRYCPSYNSYTKLCAAGGCADSLGFVQYECCYAVSHQGVMRIVVLYNSTYANREKCPALLRRVGTHVPARRYDPNGGWGWDYQVVRRAIEG